MTGRRWAGRLRGRRWLIAASCAAAFGLAPTVAQASASGPVLKPLLRALASGADSDYALRLDVSSAPGALCRARVDAGRASAQLPALDTAAFGSGTWTWDVPAGAPRGRWHFTVACRSVLRSATSRISLGNVAPVGRGHATRALVKSAHALAQPVGLARGVGYGASAFNIYPWGECTWYAFSRRPDLAVNYGNARDWFTSAQRRGAKTGTTPVPGAVAVFQPGVDGAGGWGHVAYVESVSGDTMRISEWNFARHHAGPGYRTLNWRSTVGQMRSGRPALGFVYGGQAGDGPGSTPSTPLPPPADNTPPKTMTAPAPGGTMPFYPYHVQGTCADGSCGLNERSQASYSDPASKVIGVKYDGDEVDIVCQTRGEGVTGRSGRSSTVWDRLTSGAYVTDYYVNTPNIDQFTPPIPQCGSPPPPPPPPPPAGPPPLDGGRHDTSFEHDDPFGTLNGGTQQNDVCGDGSAHHGSCFLDVSAPAAPNNTFVEDFPYSAVPGQCLMLSSWFRSRSAPSYSGVLAIWARNMQSDQSASTPFTVGAGWTQVTVTMRVPAPPSGPPWSSLRAQLYMNTPGQLLDWDLVQWYGPFSC